MIGYLESAQFYIIYLFILIGLCSLSIVFLIFRDKSNRVLKLEPIIRFLLISSITVFILDSIPYLFIDIYDVPIINIILSNIFLMLIGISAILYQFGILKDIQVLEKKNSN
jgi:hypothetical protein